jgi:hypothetical protein
METLTVFIRPEPLGICIDEGYNIDLDHPIYDADDNVIRYRATLDISHDDVQLFWPVPVDFNIVSFYFCPNLQTKDEIEPCNDMCLIRRESDDINTVVTECKHLFHKECINEWFQNNGTCSLCLKVIAYRI